MATIDEYQGLCEELDLSPYAAMDEYTMQRSIDEMMLVARQTPGSRYYLT